MSILLAPQRTRPPVQPAVPNPFSQVAEMIWTGWDGTTFDLTGLSSGVSLRAGVRGLNAPQWARFRAESPAIAGSRFRGVRGLDREVFWPIGIYSDRSSEDWLEYDRAFWRMMDPRRPGIWAVTREGSETRTLSCRFVDDGSHAFMIDPTLIGWESYGITLTAEQPFWEGVPQVRTFDNSSVGSFFGAGAPSFTISSGNSMATASIDNPGDESAWPVWVIHGPFTSASVGVGSRTVTVPLSLTAGQWLTIDTRPSAQTAIDHAGVERTGQVGNDFAMVPAGTSVPITATMVGTGRIDVSLTPLYHRAW